MIDSVGNTTRAGGFHITGSTLTLSNAQAPDNNNWTGFADGICTVWLLQPPLGLGTSTSLSVTVLARVDLTVHNPAPGFMSTFVTPSPTPQPGPSPTPTPGETPDWQIVLSFSQNTARMPEEWILSHTGDAWLAGGYYFNFHNAGYNNPGPVNKVEVKGKPHAYAVYKTDHAFGPWTTAWGLTGVPKFFVIFWGPISHTICLVGYTEDSYQYAKDMADSNTGAIPRNTELAITYGTYPTVLAFTGQSTITNPTTISFYTVYEGSNKFAVYNNETPVSFAATFARPTLATAMSRTLPAPVYRMARSAPLAAPNLRAGPSHSSSSVTPQDLSLLLPPWRQSSRDYPGSSMTGLQTSPPNSRQPTTTSESLLLNLTRDLTNLVSCLTKLQVSQQQSPQSTQDSQDSNQPSPESQQESQTSATPPEIPPRDYPVYDNSFSSSNPHWEATPATLPQYSVTSPICNPYSNASSPISLSSWSTLDSPEHVYDTVRLSTTPPMDADSSD